MTYGQKVGYARVSSASQDLEAQLERLRGAKCVKVFEETYSGKSAQRPGLEALLGFLREGDTLVVTKLDRLARSAVDLGKIAANLEKNGIELVVLDQHIDTSTPAGRLMFNMIGAFAEFERDLIRERCLDGIERAKEKGVTFGRKAILSKAEIAKLTTEFSAEDCPRSELASRYGISKPTMYRLVRDARNMQPSQSSTTD